MTHDELMQDVKSHYDFVISSHLIDNQLRDFNSQFIDMQPNYLDFN